MEHRSAENRMPFLPRNKVADRNHFPTRSDRIGCPMKEYQGQSHLDIPLSSGDHVADAVLARKSHSKPHWSDIRAMNSRYFTGEA